MKRQLISEKTITYIAQQPGTAAGTLFNGVVAASTNAGPMAVGGGTATVGYAIPIQDASRALVSVLLGAITGSGTFTAWVTSTSDKANGTSLYQVKNFSMAYVGTDDGKILKGEIDLRGITLPAPIAGDAGMNLWIKCDNLTDANVAITVQLADFEYEPTAEVLTIPVSLS